MDVLPICLKLTQRPCAVIGGGEVAARKVSLLLAAGGRVTVTAPELCSNLARLARENKIEHRAQSYTPDCLTGVTLVIAATNDRQVNASVSRDAQERQLPVNVVDDPDLCSFIMPAIVDRSPVLIAISTGGASPVLARLLRARLESLIPAAYGRLANLAARFRERVKSALPEERRRAFWEQALTGPAASQMLAGQEAAAEATLAAALTSPNAAPATGEVYLVGAGPGNPDLLTFAALRLMQQADVVLHDQLVPPAILDLVRRDAERIDVGKAGAKHTLPQPDINQQLVTLAQSGKRVLRLKGGDPYIFGRGAEEIAELAAAGIPFQVVPGITAATGAAAFAGIPLTHRDHADSVVFVTGHAKDGKLDLDWLALTRPRQTVVVYMGRSALPALCAGLIAHGRSGATPAALVSRATQADQSAITGTLDDLAAKAQALGPEGPSLVIVGETVGLHPLLGAS